MTQGRIPSNYEGFPAFYPQLQTHPPYVDLTPEIESASPPRSEHKPQHRSAREDRWQRECRRALEFALKRLSEKELAGKDHIETYLRDQYRRHLRPNTLGNTSKGIEGFMFFIQGRGRAHLEQISRQDIEAWVEQEQDRGLKASTVNMRLGMHREGLCPVSDGKGGPACGVAEQKNGHQGARWLAARHGPR